jgi:hypothetical protein
MELLMVLIIILKMKNLLPDYAFADDANINANG